MSISPNERAASPYAKWMIQTQAKPESVSTPESLQLLRVSEVARLLGCCGAHVRRLIAAGHLRAIRFGKRGSHRIPLSELQRIAALKEQEQE